MAMTVKELKEFIETIENENEEIFFSVTTFEGYDLWCTIDEVEEVDGEIILR